MIMCGTQGMEDVTSNLSCKYAVYYRTTENHWA